MKKEISALVDKALTKGMALLETEKAQKLLSSPQAQKLMDLGMSALTMAQTASESFKSHVAEKMGFATQKEVDDLRNELNRLEAEKAACASGADEAKA